MRTGWLTMAGIVLAMAAPAWGQAPDRYDPAAPTVGIADLGYGMVQGDSIAAPIPTYNRKTAVVPTSNAMAQSDADRAMKAEAARLAETDRRRAYDYLMGQLDRSPRGLVEMTIANLYINDADGQLPGPQTQAYEWLSRAAEKAPYFWHHVGNGYYNGYWGASADPAKAAQVWARGVRLGCGKCAVDLGDFWDFKRKGVDVPIEDAFAYTIFALDMGDKFELFERMQRIFERVPPRDEPRFKAIHVLRDKTEELTGDDDWRIGGIARAIFTTYRTGMVPEEVPLVHSMIDQGDFGRAYNEIGGAPGASGRYLASLFDHLMQSVSAKDPDFFTPSHVRFARTIALVGGDLRQLMPTAEVFLTGYDVLPSYGKAETLRLHNISRGAKMVDAARLAGTFDAGLAAALGPKIEKAQLEWRQKEWNDCYQRWSRANSMKTQTTLANGRKIRNMAFIEACEDSFMAVYHQSGRDAYYAQMMGEYQAWMAALAKDRDRFDRKMARFLERRSRSGGPAAASSYMTTTPDPNAFGNLSTARGWTNYQTTCSASGGTAAGCN